MGTQASPIEPVPVASEMPLQRETTNKLVNSSDRIDAWQSRKWQQGLEWEIVRSTKVCARWVDRLLTAQHTLSSQSLVCPTSRRCYATYRKQQGNIQVSKTVVNIQLPKWGFVEKLMQCTHFTHSWHFTLHLLYCEINSVKTSGTTLVIPHSTTRT